MQGRPALPETPDTPEGWARHDKMVAHWTVKCMIHRRISGKHLVRKDVQDYLDLETEYLGAEMLQQN